MTPPSRPEKHVFSLSRVRPFANCSNAPPLLCDSPFDSSQLQVKCKAYKKTLQALRKDFEAARGRVDREGLLAGAGKGREDRNRLLQTTDNLGRQNDTLDKARRVMAETEDVALEITEELGRNREKIQSARSKVLEVSGMTNQARRLVHSMSKRETQQKIMMYGLALVLVGAIVVVVYYMQK